MCTKAQSAHKGKANCVNCMSDMFCLAIKVQLAGQKQCFTCRACCGHVADQNSSIPVESTPTTQCNLQQDNWVTFAVACPAALLASAAVPAEPVGLLCCACGDPYLDQQQQADAELQRPLPALIQTAVHDLLICAALTNLLHCWLPAFCPVCSIMQR